MTVYKYGDVLYKGFIRTETEYLETVASRLERVSEDALLPAVKDEWERHVKSVSLIRAFLMYLDRVHIANHKELTPLYQLGLNLWRDLVACSPRLGPRLRALVLESVARDRAGGLLPAAQHAHHPAHPGERLRAGPFDRLQRRAGLLGAGPGDGDRRLRGHHDPGDVVRDDVVQLPGQLHPLVVAGGGEPGLPAHPQLAQHRRDRDRARPAQPGERHRGGPVGIVEPQQRHPDDHHERRHGEPDRRAARRPPDHRHRDDGEREQLGQ